MGHTHNPMQLCSAVSVGRILPLLGQMSSPVYGVSGPPLAERLLPVEEYEHEAERGALQRLQLARHHLGQVHHHGARDR